MFRGRRRRPGALTALALGGLLIALGATACSRVEPAQQIVLILVDTLRRDHLSCYGSTTPTPHLDRLAERGQIFTNALASFHQTTMSMGALFTGRTPSLEASHGVLPWNGRSWCGLTRFADSSEEETCLPKSVRTLPEILRDAGYRTIGIVSNRLLFQPSGFERGFADWIEVGGATWQEVNAAAIEAMKRRDRDRLFLYVHYMDVHDHRLGGQSYAHRVNSIDRGVGELLDALKKRGLQDDAAIVFTSDHGERLGETHFTEGSAYHYGNPSFAEVLRVPLIVSPPHFEGTARLVRSQDVFRLIVELAGLRVYIPSELEPNELILTETHWRIYRKGRWKSLMPRLGKAHYLIDLIEDPGEQRNVADEHPAIVAEHRQRTATLVRNLAASNPPPSKRTAEDQRRLRALGYLE